MKTIKIIDLLNLVYEKKAPKKILYKYCEYEFNKYEEDYINKDGLYLFAYLFSNEEQVLFLEIGIIEETEKPKKIEEFKFGEIEDKTHYEIKQRCEIDKTTLEEFEQKYRVVDCKCGEPYCHGYRCLDLDDFEKENTNLKQALNEIREICYGSDMSKQEYDKVLQIIDKHMKEE